MSIGLGIGVQRPKQLRSIYSVNGKVPGFTADFIKNKYPGHSSLSSAITHARAGNATMTDGYGDELVVNGGFDSDSDWTKGTGWSIADGVATANTTLKTHSLKSVDPYQGANGKTYIVTATFTMLATPNANAGVRINIGGVGENVFIQSERSLQAGQTYTISGFGTPTSVSGDFYVEVSSTAHYAMNYTIDNISVREMPVIKWAPHNLLTYSEDPSSSLTSTNDASWTTNNTLTATAQSGNQTPYARVLQTFTQKGTYVFAVETTSTTVQYLTLQTQIFDANANGVSVFDIQSGSVNTEASQHTATITATSEGFLCAIEFELDGTDLNGYLTMGLSEVSGIHRIVDPDGTESVTVTRLRSYRSDLGGMVDNPDRGDAYVPTTSAAKYLPRVGHHVFNGDAWVNEGVLAESEARTNLIDYSRPDTNWTLVRTTITENDAVSPDGTQNATRINETTDNGNHYINANPTNVTSGLDYTLSVYVKADTSTACQLLYSSTGFGNTHYASFDLSTGTVGYVAADATATIQDVGNGWYRCAVTSAATSTVSSSLGFIIFVDNDASSSLRAPSYAGDTAQQMYVYGAQVEQASTPSSLIPTSGSTVSRAAESFTIPSANLPWPTPQYIGSELVTNGDGSSTDDWSAARSNSTLSVTGGRLRATATASGAYGPVQTISGLTVGNVYQAKADVFTGGGSGQFFFRVVSASDLNATSPVNTGVSSDTSISVEFVATATTMYVGAIHVASAGGDYIELDNISVREINPLSVSIGMEGRMTYADTDNAEEIKFWQWQLDGNNKLQSSLWTNSTNVGAVYFQNRENAVLDRIGQGSPGSYSPDINVPLNIASRHGSTFVNGAVDGVALTADTTPTALPDLSSTDLNLAYDYMGTISEFRVWDKDLGDAGIVEATNPSLEPSLSLTFEGTGTNSFVVNNWSE